MGHMTVLTYRFYLDGVEVKTVEPQFLTEEEASQANADLARLGMSGRWKRKVVVEAQREKPEFPVYFDAQGREHAEF